MKSLASKIVTAVVLFAATVTQAAPVTLSNTALTGLGDLNLDGFLVTAGNAAGGNINVGGISFGAAGNPLGGGFGDANPSNAIGDANFDAFLDTASFGVGSVSFNGLVTGEDYHGQLYFTDNRGCCSGRTVTVSDGGVNTIVSAPIGTPQLVDFSFTADASTQALNISGSATGYLAGFQLRATSIEPQGTPIGNRLVSMAAASDGAQNVFFSNQVEMTAGSANSVSIFNQGAVGTFQMFQLRPTETPGDFEVIYDSGVMTTRAGIAGTVEEILFPNGKTTVMDGDIFAHFGRGIPFNSGSVLQEGDGGINRVAINFPADLSNVSIGATIRLDGTTGGLPIRTDLVREYALAVNVFVPEPTTAMLGLLGMASLGLRRRRNA